MSFRLGVWLLLPAAAFAQAHATHGDAQLDALIADALARNPQVREAFAHYQAARARVPQATALPDPMLSVTQHARTPETRVGPQTTLVSVSQRFPWFGKLSDQGKLAAKRASVQAELYEARRAEVVRQLKLAYFDLRYIDRALAIAGEETELLEHYETFAQARYSQGAGLQQSVVKLQAEITRLLNRTRELERQRVDAESVVNTLRDRRPDEPIAPAGAAAPLVRPSALPDAQQLYALGREHRPEVAAAFLQIETEEKAIHLARRQYYPDFTVGAAWGNVIGRRDEAGRMSPPQGNGKDVYSVTVGVNIPIFRSKYDAGVLEASERFTASREAYRSVVDQVELSVRTIAFRIQTLDEQMALFERALIPQAQQALQSAETGYSTGVSGVLDLLDSERVLLDAKLGLARLESDYSKALAEMERAIGTAFPLEASAQPEVRP